MTEGAPYEERNPSPTETVDEAVQGVAAGQARRPTLSLIMIVRDEAENMPAVLGPLQGKFDEIIVVDTGSLDGTPEIARAHGATVHFFEWINDFAAARNESIRHATSDWLFWLDADDRMPPEELDRVRSLITLHPNRDTAYYCHLRSLGASWTAEQNLLQVRLFPNLPGVHFVGEVHERITESLRGKGIAIHPSAVEIIHVGYVDPDALPEKYARNYEIMSRMLEENPRELQTRYQLIMQLAAMVDVEQTLEQVDILGEHVAEVTGDVDRTYRFLLLRGIVHRNFGDMQVAREAYEEVIRTFPEMGVSHYLLSTVLYEEEKWDEMREHLLKAEYYGIAVDAVPIPLARVLFDMSSMMAMYYQRAGQWMRAAPEFRKALALQEEYLTFYSEMAVCYARGGAHDRALAACRLGIRVHDLAVERISTTNPERLESGMETAGTVAELSPESRESCLAGLYCTAVSALMDLQQVAAAQATLEEGVRRLPESTALMGAYVDWMLRARRVDGAMRWAEKLIEATDEAPKPFEAVVNLFLQHGVAKEAAILLRRLWKANPSKWDAALVCLLSALQVGDADLAEGVLGDITRRLTTLGVADDWPTTLTRAHPVFAHFAAAPAWVQADEASGDDRAAYAQKLAATSSAAQQLVQERV